MGTPSLKDTIFRWVEATGFSPGHVEKGVLGYGGRLTASFGYNCTFDFAMIDERDSLSPVKGLHSVSQIDNACPHRSSIYA